MARKRTDLIGGRGENLVINAFAEHLGWAARKDAPDDGVDLNVEVPAVADKPSERFLVQVKTAQTAKELKLGHWSTSIKRTALTKYKQSRHAVFLFVVNLRNREIRWLNLSEVLRVHPQRQTFSLAPTQIFDENTAQAFADAVRSAMLSQDDLHHSPREALGYRARKFEAQDPRFSVSAEFVGGVEKYTFAPKPGSGAKMTISPKTRADAKRVKTAIEFGSKADVQITSFKFDGPSVLGRDDKISSLMIEPHAQDLRIVVTSVSEGASCQSVGIELDAEIALGIRGFELRSKDSVSPLHFRFRADKKTKHSTFTIQIEYQNWNGRMLSNLPLLDRILEFTRALLAGGRVIFEVSDYGEKRELLSAHLSDSYRDGLKQIVDQLEFCSRLSQICRKIGSIATFNASETPSDSQLRWLGLAFSVIRDGTVDCQLGAFTVTPKYEGLAALRAKSRGSLLLRVPMNLFFGSTTIGALPVQSIINDYDISENKDGSFTMKPLSPSPLSLDMDVGWSPQGET